MRSITYLNKTIRLIDHVYEPKEDSFLMVDALQAHMNKEDRILEVGCGSGIVSMFAVDNASLVIATDLNPYAVRCAKINGITSIVSDLFAGIRGSFDLIVFNPPYLPTSEGDYLGGWDDLMLDGGPDGRRTIKRFLAGIGEHLAPGGRILLLVSSLTGIKEVCDLMRHECLYIEQVAESKFFFEQLVVLKGQF
jgi:release factor glutamine methyltransferase